MNSEIELLKKQRKEIDHKIKELMTKEISAGKARIAMEHYPTSKPDRWYLGICVQDVGYEQAGRQKFSYRSVINGKTKKDVVLAIPGLIADLNELYEKAVCDGGED